MTTHPAIARHDRRFLYRAFLLSIAAHILVALIKVSGVSSPLQPSFELIVKLVPMKMPEPAPLPAPPPAPTPLPPPEKPKPQPVPAAAKKAPLQTEADAANRLSAPPVERKNEALTTVITDANPAPITAPAPVDAPSAAAAPSKTEAPPAPTVPTDTTNARGQYGALLSQAIAKFKKYPALAKLAKQQGMVLLQLQINAQGELLAAHIAQSSGFESLDNQALDMAKKAAPFSPPPSHLAEHDMQLLVPVSFRLNY